MKIIDNILWIELADFISAGWTLSTVHKANHRNGAYWQMMPDPSDKRRPLVKYEDLRDEHKAKLKAQFGDVYLYTAKSPILRRVERDAQAEAFYLAYRYDGKSISQEHVAKYTTASSWLNMVIKATADKKALKKELNLMIADFYSHVLDLIGSEGVDLPTSYKRFTAKLKDYQDNGYASLIDWRFGRQPNLKVKDEVCEATLLELLSDPRQHDDVFISYAYNAWAQKQGYETITHATVGNWRRKHAHLITMPRNGNKEWRDTYGLVIKGRRPSKPTLMWEHDDNHLDLFFTTERDGKEYGYQRVKGIFIIDSYNDYILGYAVTSGELKANHIRLAYLNAMHHIHELTGSWYLPHETKSDRWNGKELMPFYLSMGNYQKSTVGGSRGRGYIEQLFGTSDWQNCLKAGNNNYNGHNISSRTAGVNREWLEANKRERPMLSEAPDQVAQFVERLRHLPTKDGRSRQDQWLQAWADMPMDARRPITHEQFLHIFGFKHEPAGRPVTITNKGVDVQIANRRFLYHIPPAIHLAAIGKQVHVVYDPLNMDQVLITDYAKVRFMANANHGIAKAMADYTDGHREQLNKLMDRQTADVATVTEAQERRREVLRNNQIDAESLLKANVLVKGIRQAAEQDYFIPDTIKGSLPAAALAGMDDDGDFDPFENM